MNILVFTTSLGGHRQSYVNSLKKEFEAEIIMQRRHLFRRDPLLFMSVDDTFLLYCFTCFVRSSIGLRTAGLLFRPKPISPPSDTKLRIKYLLLRVLKAVNLVTTILLIPQKTDKRFYKISDGWFYDFQLWDLEESDYLEYEQYRKGKKARVACSSNSTVNKYTVHSIGSQNRLKGSDSFIQSYIQVPEIREKFLFVVSGAITEVNISSMKSDFEKSGGVIIDRELTSEELLETYASSDLIWALYAQDYDQASGIFGRAVQLGIPVIVRKESIIHKICINTHIEHIALTSNTVLDLNNYRALIPNISRGKELGKYFRAESVRGLKRIFVNEK